MKTALALLLLSLATMSYGQTSTSITEKNRICNGHGMIERIWGDFNLAKTTKEKWDEQTPYDRSIKDCKSEMYKDENRWVIEYSWTHVDNSPKCDNYVVMEASEKELNQSKNVVEKD